jgi:hypothetical protein
VQPLNQGKVGEQCTTTRLASTGRPGGCNQRLQEIGFLPDTVLEGNTFRVDLHAESALEWPARQR